MRNDENLIVAQLHLAFLRFHNAVIDWVSKHQPFVRHTSSSIEDGAPPRATRLIDTHLAPPLSLQQLMKYLARRNLRRGYLLNLPTAECMAEHFGLTPLTPKELFADIELDEMSKEIFHGRTPLWFYILREAELAGGNHLGTLGSHIVATVLIGMIQASPRSFLNQSWNPADGVRTEDGSPIETIEHLLQCAGVL